MSAWSGKSLVAFLLGLLAFSVAIPCQAFGTGKITEVKLSADCKRLIIKSEGPLAMPRALPFFRPAKLILDFYGSAPGPRLQNLSSHNKGVPDVRVNPTPTGTRIELDFGAVPLPRYRVRRLNDHVIVFLEQTKAVNVPESAPRPAISAAKPPLSRSVSAQKRRLAPKRAQKPAPTIQHRDGLFIKSSSVVNGNIVLHVADGKRPRRVYRIQLGVDLSQPGFKSAEIRRSPGKDAKGPS